jgi:hypothetical protein
MLKLLFSWLDHHVWVYWAIVAGPTLALIGSTFASFWRAPEAAARPRRDWGFMLLVVAVLLAWRWPFLLEAKELNPDEGQFIAGARTLAHDPVFWRSVDGTTSGPLNFYVLLPLSWLHLPLDYFMVRLLGLLLVSIALLVCYRWLRRRGEAGPARLALLPVLVFFATVTDDNLIHFSSEHVSLALLAVAAYGLFRHGPAGGDRRGALVGAAVAGLLPWAKLQAAPLGAVLVAGKLALLLLARDAPPRTRLRAAAEIAVAAVLPSVVALGLIVAAGQWAGFIQGYVRQNFVYVDGGVTIAQTVRELWGYVIPTKLFLAFLASVSLCLGACGVTYVLVRRWPGRLTWLMAGLTVIAFICVLTPRRPFVHYLLLTVIPLGWWLGSAVAELWPAVRHRRVFGAVLLVLGGLAPLGFRLQQTAPVVFGRFAECWRHPYSVGGAILRAYAGPDDALAVWGWKTDLYVDSGMRQATRDPHTPWAIWVNPNRDYYRARFLQDLRRSRPTFFVDAVGPGSSFFENRSGCAHETFPALAELIRQEYFLLVDVGTERIYARWNSPVAARGKLPVARLQRIARTARASSVAAVPEPASLVPANLGRWDLEGRSVQMMLPPARMTWVLKGDEREVTVEFGFHPRAYTEGHSNGADLIVELEAPGHPASPLLRRRLDPAREKADRGMLTAHIALPPFVAGTRIIVRTEPGEYGDQAWDWVFLAALRTTQVPVGDADQYPGFNSVPDLTDVAASRFGERAGRRCLIVTAPAAFTYILEGSEQRFSFACEFADGAAPAPARYQVEYYHGEKPMQVLASREVPPAAGGNGPPVAITLPRTAWNDRLVLRLLPGGANPPRELPGLTLREVTLK